MQYLSLAIKVAWPQIAVAILWFAAALGALRYAQKTQRPVFLFGGITALLLSLSEVLSPVRMAFRYVTGRVYCPSVDACSVELQFGAAKFEWLILACAAVLFFVGLYLEVARARRRAANNAARAAMAGAAEGYADAYAYQDGTEQAYTDYESADYAASYDAASAEQVDPAYQGAMPDAAQQAQAAPPPEYEQPTIYRRPSSGSGSGSF